MPTTDRPAPAEYAPYYSTYVDLVPAGDVIALLRANGEDIVAMLAAVPESRGGFRYAAGKWSIREIVGHLIDAERIFSYRALRIARGDTTPLASFDENIFAAAAGSDGRTLTDLLDEVSAVRESTVRLFASLPASAWTRVGVASDKEVSVRALAHITLGHSIHHLRVLAERYGLEKR